MKTNMTAALVAATMMAVSLAPMASAAPGSYDYHEQVTGPGGVHVWNLVLVGGALCTDDIPTGDLACDPGPGNIKSAGGAFFDISDRNAGGAGFAALDLRINAEYIADSGLELGGFLIDACTDRNDNSFCGDEGVDHGTVAYANDADATGDCKKDSKTVCDGTDAQIDQFCVQRDGNTLDIDLLPDGAWDDVVVFVFLWAKESATGLTGTNDALVEAGATVGSFDVYAEFLGYHNDTQRCADQTSWP